MDEDEHEHCEDGRANVKGYQEEEEEEEEEEVVEKTKEKNREKNECEEDLFCHILLRFHRRRWITSERVPRGSRPYRL
ncbi:hypothetical protein CRENBAI_006911 [Crenichthys baileyi]|uniref:Uncharacterized protein n=1 Tax=Crenichthys baileyi TaxID=28760 RepID=A0AAV9S8F5_9TELE